MDVTHRIPPELLVEIFAFTLPEIDFGLESYNPFNPSDRLPSSVHSLSCVSQRWRTITLGAPHLWSSLVLPALPNDPSHIEAFFQLLQRLLERSQSQPLSFNVYFEDVERPDSSTRTYIERYLDILSRHSHRWLDVRLYLEFQELWPNSILFPMLDTGENMTPLLHSFSLFAPGFDRAVTVTHFRDAPRLRAINLEYVLPMSWELPWSQLTRLRMTISDYRGPVNPDGFMRVLSQCTSLEHLRLDFVFSETRVLTIPIEPAIVPSLRCLQIDFKHARDTVFQTFLDNFQTPCLHTLIIHPGWYLHDDPPQSVGLWAYHTDELQAVFLKFLGSCKGTLRKLEVQELAESESLFRTVFQTLRNLTSLTLPTDAFTPSIVDFLTLRPQSALAEEGSTDIVVEGPLPYLADLSIQASEFRSKRMAEIHAGLRRTLLFDNLADMVESRWRLTPGAIYRYGPGAELLNSGERIRSRLRAFRLSEWHWTRMAEDYGEAHARFEAMRREGLHDEVQ